MSKVAIAVRPLEVQHRRRVRAPSGKPPAVERGVLPTTTIGTYQVSALEKDRSVIDTVAALQARLGNDLVAVDHWEADLTATGVARSSNPARLVYFSILDRAPNRYYVDLEFPPRDGSDLPYEQGDRFDDVDFEQLVSIVSRHLSLDD